MRLDKHFKIYKDGERINLRQAYKLVQKNVVTVYWLVGPKSLANPHYCEAMLWALKDRGLINGFGYYGPPHLLEIPPLGPDEVY